MSSRSTSPRVQANVEVLYPRTPGIPAPDAQAQGVAGFATGSGDRELENWLANAPVATRAAADGYDTVALHVNGRMLDALFEHADRDARNDAARREVAAYRLDRMLELGLVPTAVLREIDGRGGSIQLDVRSWPDEQARTNGGQQAAEWCPLGDQFNLMYVFDALSGSAPRQRAQLRYLPGSWQLALVGNGSLFPTDGELPNHLREAPIRLSSGLAARLETLTPALLDAELGDVLDERQRAAILERRDRLIDHFARD